MNNETESVNCCIIDAMCGIDTASPHITQYTDSFSQIKFLLSKDLGDYTIMIITDIDGYVHIVPTDGESLEKTVDENGNTMLIWNIGKEITASEGVVIYQIAAYKHTDTDTESVWYSKEGRLFVCDSIDSTNFSASVIGSNPNLLTKLILQLDSQAKYIAEHSQKLSGIEEGAEVNVQSDWQETDPEADSFIHGKPDIGAIKSELEGKIDDAKSDAYKAIDEAKVMAGNVGTALDVHRNNEDENAQHLTAIEKETLQSRITDIDSIIEEIERVDGVIDGVRGDIFQESERLNQLADEVYGLEDRVLVLEATSQTEVPTTLEANTSYNFGMAEELSFAFPDVANDGDVIYITFKSNGTQATNLIVNTINLHGDFDLVPEHGEGYELYAKYIDGGWLVKYSSYSPNSFERLPEIEEG